MKPLMVSPVTPGVEAHGRVICGAIDDDRRGAGEVRLAAALSVPVAADGLDGAVRVDLADDGDMLRAAAALVSEDDRRAEALRLTRA